MFYVLQENVYKEHHWNTLKDYLERYNLEYEIVPWRPFIGKVEVKTKRKDVWFWGSIDTGIELQDHGWYPGIMYSYRHDFELYKARYGGNMLNSDAVFQNFGYIENEWLDFFVRPTRDTKIFTAKVYDKKEWNDYVRETIDSGSLAEIRKKTRMMVCSPKAGIQQEIRCWIVDGEPVTMSQYKIGRRVNMLNMDNNQEAYIFAKNMAKIFSPSRVYVLDICLYQDEYKIVEINCANMSGFYDISMSKLIQSLENAFSHGREDGRSAA